MLKILIKGFSPFINRFDSVFLQKKINLADLIAKGIRALRVVRELISTEKIYPYVLLSVSVRLKRTFSVTSL